MTSHTTSRRPGAFFTQKVLSVIKLSAKAPQGRELFHRRIGRTQPLLSVADCADRIDITVCIRGCELNYVTADAVFMQRKSGSHSGVPAVTRSAVFAIHQAGMFAWTRV